MSLFIALVCFKQTASCIDHDCLLIACMSLEEVLHGLRLDLHGDDDRAPRAQKRGGLIHSVLYILIINICNIISYQTSVLCYKHINTYTYVYIYIYIEREREREIHI